MRIWHTMSQERFLEELRMSAIAQNASRAVIDQLDQLVLAPTEDEIEERETEAHERGIDEGRESQHELTSAAVTALFGKAHKHLKFTQEQVDAIRDALKKAEPES